MFYFPRNFSRARCFFPPAKFGKMCLGFAQVTVMASSQQVSIQISFLVFPCGCFSSLMNDLELSLSIEHLIRLITSSFFKKTNYNAFVLSCVSITRHCCPFEAKSINLYMLHLDSCG